MQWLYHMAINMLHSFFESDAVLHFDMIIYQWVEAHFSGTVLDFINSFLSTIGDGGLVWIFIALLCLLSKKSRKTGVVVIGALAVALVLNNLLLKELVDRTRPYLLDSSVWNSVAQKYGADWFYNWPGIVSKPSDASFPSGHTASSFAAATAIFWRDKKKGIPALVLAVLIGFSRIYVHVHYPTDVIGGVISGIICGVIACVIILILLKKPLNIVLNKVDAFEDKIVAKFSKKPVPADGAQQAEIEKEAQQEKEAEAESENSSEITDEGIEEENDEAVKEAEDEEVPEGPEIEKSENDEKSEEDKKSE